VSDFPWLGIRGLQRLARGRLSYVKGDKSKGIPALTIGQLKEQLESFDFSLAEIEEAIAWQDEQTARSKQSKQTKKQNH
jgi:hypothetical protein